jgi:hypothetical protein
VTNGDGSGLSRGELLRLDYDHTLDHLRTLTDVRFKLLAFVPTIAGASVGLVGRGRAAADLVAVGLLGLVATFGVLLYELRNSQVYHAIVDHARELEQKLGLGLSSPRSRVTLFGIVAARHDRGLGLVYGSALAGWTYLVAWGALRALDVGSARTIGAVIGFLAGVVVAAEVERVGETMGEPEAST